MSLEAGRGISPADRLKRRPGVADYLPVARRVEKMSGRSDPAGRLSRFAGLLIMVVAIALPLHGNWSGAAFIGLIAGVNLMFAWTRLTSKKAKSD
jgi:hypothetical protein